MLVQRNSADAPANQPAEQGGQLAQHPHAQPAADAATGATAVPASHSAQRKTLRTYGQKKAKADPAAEQATASLPADFLALVGGKR